MLPGDTASHGSPWAASARFGVYAMEVLINEMIHLGADRRRMVAKVFGGARGKVPLVAAGPVRVMMPRNSHLYSHLA